LSSKTKSNIITIREMKSTDLDLVVELEHKIFPDPWPYNAFKEQVEEKNWGGIVAESERGIIGYACYYVAAAEAHLTNIAVVEKFRRKSVAKLLLDNILEVVAKHKCEYLLLEVRPSNSSAISFYEKHDFKLLYRRPKYYHSPIEDAIVMVRYFEQDGE